MNFDLSEEQELFTSTVERFTAPVDVEARRVLRSLPKGYDPARWSEIAELGLIALAAPEDAGGMGGSALDLALVGEALGKGNAPDPWLENGILPARLLAAAGANDTLENVLSGETVVAVAWAERARRYNWVPAGTKLSGGAITGEKTFVLGAALAGHLIVTALDGDTTAFFLIPSGRDGVEIRQYRLADGSISGEVQLRGVAVSDDDRLDISSEVLAQITADMRLLASAELMGLGQRLLDDTVAYVKEREQFGVPIGSFQALQHRLVECYAKIEQSRSMLYRIAMAATDDPASVHSAAAGAKAYIAESVDHVAREAVQMHGGMGVTDELAIGHAMKRVLVLAQLFGEVDTNLAEYSKAA
ncbi:MAG: acyl-CoA dehydrogenase family protein [Erythrobacter sp.]